MQSHLGMPMPVVQLVDFLADFRYRRRTIESRLTHGIYRGMARNPLQDKGLVIGAPAVVVIRKGGRYPARGIAGGGLCV